MKNFLSNVIICFVIVTICGMNSAFCKENKTKEAIENIPQEIKLVLEDTDTTLNAEISETAVEVKEGLFDKIFAEDQAIIRIDNKYLKNFKLNGAIQAFTRINKPENGTSTGDFTFLDTHLWFTGNINETTDYKIMFNPLRDSWGYDGFQTIFSDVFIRTKTSANTQLLVGQMRTPIGMDGGWGQYDLPFVFRSQIGRTFGNIRALGVKSKGNFKYWDYDIGFYDSARLLTDLFQGTETTAWVNVKPLAKFGDKYGKLKIGSGVNHGKRDNTYTVIGAYANYEYKKFGATVEYSHADGYNGLYTGRNEAEGIYGTLTYFIHPKVQLLTRFDRFIPNTNKNHNAKDEYTLGINYYVKGERLKFVFNYIFGHNQATGLANNKFVLMTQMLF